MKKNSLDNILDYLFCFSVIIWPFYLFTGSSPQIIHYLILISFVLIFLNYSKLLFSLVIEEFFLKILIGIGIYSLLVNLFWSFTYSTFSPIFGSVKILFICLTIINFFFLIKYQIISNKKLLIFLIISLFFQLLIFIFINQFNYNFKPINFFYYKTQFSTYLLILSFLFVYYFNKKYLSFQILILLFLITSFLLIMSGSVYASLINIVMLLFNFLLNFKKILILNKQNIFSLFLIFILFFFYLVFFDNNFVFNIYKIIHFYQENDANFYSRGYLRLFNNWQYLLFGAGYGLNFRYLLNIDLHSTFLNIIFQYGIIGSFFVLIFFQRLFKINQNILLINFLILLLYTLAHDIFNQIFFWFTYLLITIQSHDKNIKYDFK